MEFIMIMGLSIIMAPFVKVGIDHLKEKNFGEIILTVLGFTSCCVSIVVLFNWIVTRFKNIKYDLMSEVGDIPSVGFPPIIFWISFAVMLICIGIKLLVIWKTQENVITEGMRGSEKVKTCIMLETTDKEGRLSDEQKAEKDNTGCRGSSACCCDDSNRIG